MNSVAALEFTTSTYPASFSTFKTLSTSVYIFTSALYFSNSFSYGIFKLNFRSQKRILYHSIRFSPILSYSRFTNSNACSKLNACFAAYASGIPRSQTQSANSWLTNVPSTSNEKTFIPLSTLNIFFHQHFA